MLYDFICDKCGTEFEVDRPMERSKFEAEKVDIRIPWEPTSLELTSLEPKKNNTEQDPPPCPVCGINRHVRRNIKGTFLHGVN